MPIFVAADVWRSDVLFSSELSVDDGDEFQSLISSFFSIQTFGLK